MRKLLATLAAATVIAAPSQAQTFTYDQNARAPWQPVIGCLGSIAELMDYNCSSIAVMTGEHSDNIHFLGNGGTVTVYILNHGSGDVQGIVLKRDNEEATSHMIEANGNCFIYKSPLVKTVVECSSFRNGNRLSYHKATLR